MSSDLAMNANRPAYHGIDEQGPYINTNGLLEDLEQEQAPSCWSRVSKRINDWRDCLISFSRRNGPAVEVAAMVAGWMLFGGGIALITLFAGSNAGLLTLGIGLTAVGLGSMYLVSFRYVIADIAEYYSPSPKPEPRMFIED